MSEPTSRFLELHGDGTATVTLTPDEVHVYRGPRTGSVARFRVQVISMDDLGAELSGTADVLPWLRLADRLRAVRELHVSGASRAILEHVASSPVAAFGPTRWTVAEIVRGRWETDQPFSSDRLCAGGGAVFEATLPIGLSDEDLETCLRAVPKDDLRRRERVAVLLDRHDDGLSAD
jgi:hypothetical protein